MIDEEKAEKIMKLLDQTEAELRRAEHRLFAIRNQLGKAFRPELKVGYYEDEPRSTDEEVLL